MAIDFARILGLGRPHAFDFIAPGIDAARANRRQNALLDLQQQSIDNQFDLRSRGLDLSERGVELQERAEQRQQEALAQAQQQASQTRIAINANSELNHAARLGDKDFVNRVLDRFKAEADEANDVGRSELIGTLQRAANAGDFNAIERYTAFRLNQLDPEFASRRKSLADAQKAETQAKFAESEAVLDLQQKGWNIKKLKNDIGVSRQNTRVAALNARLKAEENDIKRRSLALKLDEAVRKRDNAIKERAVEGQAAMESANLPLGLVDFFLDNDGENVKKIAGTIDAPLSSVTQFIPGSAASAILPKFEQLKNALSVEARSKLKGQGTISDKEAEMLGRSVTSLGRAQSDKAIVAEMQRIKKVILRAKKRITEEYGTPNVEPVKQSVLPDDNRSESVRTADSILGI
jgi:hypothetical protein